MPPPRLTIAIAPNAFKGTLTARQAAAAIHRGMRDALPNARFLQIPVADGGDGTLDALLAATAGTIRTSRVRDPLGRPVRARWGLLPGRVAIIEMAAASGLTLLAPRERRPLRACTFGTGQLIRNALDAGATHILLGIGGSATSDGGSGALRALEARFLDRRGHELPPGGGSLNRLHRIDLSNLDPRLRQARLQVACDVTNPLVGPRGAARIYAPQKGATPAMVRQLEAGLRRFATVLRRDFHAPVARMPGAGAAGGIGAGLFALAGAQLVPGVQMVLDALQLPQRFEGCDLVITGEGRLDAQTAHGKAPDGVARVALSLKIPCIAICGSVAPDAANRLPPGITACFAALTDFIAPDQLPRHAAHALAHCARQVGRLLALSFVRRTT